MKILLVGVYTSSEDRKHGGPGAVLSNLVDSIAKSKKINHEVDIISQSFSFQRGRIKLVNSTIVYLVPILNLKELLGFINLLSQKRYDVINLQGATVLNMITTIFGKIFGARIVYSCHGLSLDDRVLGRARAYSVVSWVRFLIQERIIVTFSDILVTVSEMFKSRIQMSLLYPRENIYVIYNGLSEYWLKNFSKAYQNRKKGRYLLFVGLTSRIKGFDLLLRAFNIIKKQHKHLRLLVVGEKPGHDLMINAGDAISDITFVSGISKALLKKMYKEAIAFVLPSRQDSFPLVVLEALSQGLPIVISDKVGSCEIIEHAKHGLIFESGNIDDLITCLELVITDLNLRKRIAKENIKLAASRSWHQVLEDYFKLFEMVNTNTSMCTCGEHEN